MNFSVCIDAIFKQDDFIESMKTISSIGFKTFEFWSWWDKDLAAIKRHKEEYGMNISVFCTKSISLVDETKRKEYIEGLKETICVAGSLGCSNLISQVGAELLDKSREGQHESLVDGLKECIPLLEKSKIRLLIEPLNTLVDHKGYYLGSSEEGFRIIEKVGSPYVKLLFDIYHQQIMEGHLISRITENIDKIGHFHAAGNPGRHELDTGEINYPNVFKAIQQAGYAGYIGLEYFPLKNPMDGLKRLME